MKRLFFVLICLAVIGTVTGQEQSNGGAWGMGGNNGGTVINSTYFYDGPIISVNAYCGQDTSVDESANIKNAIENGSYKLILFEPGINYKVSDEIIIPQNCILDGQGDTLFYNLSDDKVLFRIRYSNITLRNFVFKPVGTMSSGSNGECHSPITINYYAVKPTGTKIEQVVSKNIKIENCTFLEGILNHGNHTESWGMINILGDATNIQIYNCNFKSQSLFPSIAIGSHWSSNSPGVNDTLTYHPNNISIENCEIDGAAYAGIFASATYNLSIKNVTFNNCYRSMYFVAGDWGAINACDEDSAYVCKNISVKNVTAKDDTIFCEIDGKVATYQTSPEVTFDNITARGTDPGLTTAGCFKIEQAGRIGINKANVSNYTYGVLINDDVDNVVITNSLFWDNFGYGIYCPDKDNDLEFMEIRDTWFRQNNTIVPTGGVDIRIADGLYINIDRCIFGIKGIADNAETSIYISNDVLNYSITNNLFQMSSHVNSGRCILLSSSPSAGITTRRKYEGNIVSNGATEYAAYPGTIEMKGNAYIEYSNALPTVGTYPTGSKIYLNNISAGDSLGLYFTDGGTYGTLNSGATTGTISASSATLTVNANTDLYVGCKIDIVGVTGTKTVESISGTTIILTSTSNASVTDAAVSFHNPSVKALPSIGS